MFTVKKLLLQLKKRSNQVALKFLVDSTKMKREKRVKIKREEREKQRKIVFEQIAVPASEIKATLHEINGGCASST